MPNLSASQAQHMTPHCLAAMAHGLESSIRHASGAPQRRSAPEPEASPPPTQRSLPVQCPRDGAQPVQRSSRQSDTIPTFSASIQPTATAIPRQAPHYPGVAQEHPAAAPRSHRPDHAEMEEAPAWMPVSPGARRRAERAAPPAHPPARRQARRRAGPHGRACAGAERDGGAARPVLAHAAAGGGYVGRRGRGPRRAAGAQGRGV